MAIPESQDAATSHIETPPKESFVVASVDETAKLEGAELREVHNAELFAALKETKIERWSKNSLHLYFCIFVAFCCACTNGYDGSLMTALLAMDHFQNVFRTGLDGYKVSVVGALYTVGCMVAAPLSAILSDKLGRRKCMFIGAWIIIIGAIIISTSSTLGQFVTGRFVLGAGVQMMLASAPAYAVEISPPHWRGRAVGFYNCGWFGGAIPAAVITYGCNYINSNYQWRIPLILQCFTCIIVAVSIWFIPESPRWLIAHSRDEEAIAFLAKYHGNGDANARLVRLEVKEMKEGIRIDGIDKRWWDYRSFLMTHSGRWRFLQVVMISVFGQWSGNGLGYVNTAVFKQLGYDSSQQQLLLNLASEFITTSCGLFAARFSDRMPRRTVLVWGSIGCAVTLAINAGVSVPISKSSTDFNPVYGRTALAFFYLFKGVFAFSYTPLQAIVPAEALETTTRAKGFALSGFIMNLMGFISMFAVPIGLKSLKSNYIWIFVGWDLFEALCWYLFGVESLGRTLEELEWVYQQPNPVKASKHLDKVVIQADGRVVEKAENNV